MRNFNFKGFDKTDGKVKDVEQIDFKKELVLFKGSDKFVNLRDVKLMQSLCFEDKNLVEIYEMYICKVIGADVEENEYFIVKMDGFGRYVLARPSMTFPFTNIERNEIEIIGNIYDNPDLIDFDLLETSSGIFGMKYY